MLSSTAKVTVNLIWAFTVVLSIVVISLAAVYRPNRPGELFDSCLHESRIHSQFCIELIKRINKGDHQ